MTDDKRPTPEEIRASRERRSSWFGYLAGDNIEHVRDRIERILTGRRYTFVSFNTALPNSRPEVRTSLTLSPRSAKDGVPVVLHRRDPNEKYSTDGITIVDTYGVGGMHTSLATEREAHEVLTRHHENEENQEYKNLTYVSIVGGNFNHGPTDPGRIEITFHNGYGEMIHWVYVTERVPDEDF